ncbi:MAG: FadR/GntR family transcriptional regulator [Pseudolysinimonas sp.]|uniref:FadR/GntR family transcriptional regulator n=1 Tax=Pseudolysinimonas sp. TaxID=2680009 RepID=UPI003267C4D3
MASTGRVAESGPDLVVRHLESLILDGGLAAGDDLPSEGELAEDLDINRLTVREGIKFLAARGLVQVQRGRRSTVAHPTSEPLNAFFSAAVRRDQNALLELLELRLAIEVSASALAAERATDEERAAIGEALDRMRSEKHDGTAYNAADLQFHARIATASGNRMFDLLMDGMEQPLAASRLESLRGHVAAHGPQIDDLIAEHEEIYDALIARNPLRAAAAMRQHLTQTREDLQRGLAPREESA